ncbi:hypothetical protein CLV62_14315 [Dysgonomonas alginatilytica]|uniref:Double-GTPase 1 domain-containing protein n=1 Tax=Dysgonomonas alginatilytica TaxID=1605892 RepID=A0A2V3PHT9_9BACT|nr:hypothetical protein [Dysgonomonas alginatilytica]PXV58835.1 hypothetical protein CLV62_14315 [Dysgonomonas alginatilytica]
MTEPYNYLLLGLPQSGKTSFLGALWYSIESQETANSLSLEALPDDREYLTELSDLWCQCKNFQRTTLGVDFPISFTVTNFKTGNKHVIDIPDMSGEFYKTTLFEERQIPIEFIKDLKDVNGVLLFINADTFIRPTSIKEVNGHLKPEVGSIDNVSEINSGSPKESKITFEISKHVPDVIYIVDLLQIIQNFANDFKLAIIISAWDVVLDSFDTEEVPISPLEWAKQELPLLVQAVESNFKEYRIYGISAQGGSYKEAEVKDKLLSNINQTERIRVHFNDEISNDITLPIRWIIEA